MIKFFCDKCKTEVTRKNSEEVIVKSRDAVSNESFCLCGDCVLDLFNWIETEDK